MELQGGEGVEGGEGGEVMSHLDGIIPQVTQGQGRGGCAAVEQVRCGVGLGVALRAGISGRHAYGMPVAEQPGALARSQLGEGGAMVSREGNF